MLRCATIYVQATIEIITFAGLMPLILHLHCNQLKCNKNTLTGQKIQLNTFMGQKYIKRYNQITTVSGLMLLL